MRILDTDETRKRVAESGIERAAIPAFGFRDDADHVAYDWHSHRHHQLLYAFEGVVHLETGDRRFLLPPQRAAWIPAGLTHRTWLEKVRSGSVFFAPGMVRSPSAGTLRILAAPPIMREMIGYAMRWPPEHPREALAESYFRTLALLCHEWLIDEEPYHLPVARSPALRRAMDYAQANLADADIRGAARAAALSERTLRRRFREEAGMGWQEYLHHSRMLHALARLGETPMRIAELAESVGYSNASTFAKAFASFAGEQPGRYRMRLGSRPG